MLTLAEVKRNPQITEFIRQTEQVLSSMSYTDHGLRHCELVSDRARTIALAIGLSKEEAEMASIAAFCHDIGNFISRSFHNYFGAMIFHQIFNEVCEPVELAKIMQAMSNHDKRISDVNFANPVSAVVILADKSDVHRSRVTTKGLDRIKQDIHDRVNYATTLSRLKVDKKKKRITLVLEIDTDVVPVMEYFEIFTDRMIFCRRAAKGLDYDFGLVINNFKLL